MPSHSKNTKTKIIINSNERRAAALLLLASICLSVTLRDALPPAKAKSSTHEQFSSVSKLANVSFVSDHFGSPNITNHFAFYNSSRPAIGEQSFIAKQQLPIYLLQPDTRAVSQMTWGRLVTEWNRATQYSDLIRNSTPTASLPSTQRGKRPVVLIHCGPKSGSTTLRVACRNNLESTCGIPVLGRLPLGYMNSTELYPVIRSCTKTSHFCTKGTIMPMSVPIFHDITFIHMFPFRTYDEWAASALKQAYDRGPDGCKKAEDLLDQCIPSSMEIDFRKYGKTDLANFKDLVVQRMNQKKETHIFILYFHRELDSVLSMLSNVYKIPLLPGSNGTGKSIRPNGTCDEGVMQKFHDCFSSELMDLK